MSQVVYQIDRHRILNIFSSQCHQPSCTVFAVYGLFWFYQDRTMFDQNPTDNFRDRTRAFQITIDIYRSSFRSLNSMSRSRHPTTNNQHPEDIPSLRSRKFFFFLNSIFGMRKDGKKRDWGIERRVGEGRGSEKREKRRKVERGVRDNPNPNPNP